MVTTDLLNIDVEFRLGYKVANVDAAERRAETQTKNNQVNPNLSKYMFFIARYIINTHVTLTCISPIMFL